MYQELNPLAGKALRNIKVPIIIKTKKLDLSQGESTMEIFLQDDIIIGDKVIRKIKKEARKYSEEVLQDNVGTDKREKMCEGPRCQEV